jgi:cyd operon protein YbgT
MHHASHDNNLPVFRDAGTTARLPLLRAARFLFMIEPHRQRYSAGRVSCPARVVQRQLPVSVVREPCCPRSERRVTSIKETAMWYFSWILGIGVALGFGIINVMWLEANEKFAHDPVPNTSGTKPPAA